jgi:hypothetical protein
VFSPPFASARTPAFEIAPRFLGEQFFEHVLHVDRLMQNLAWPSS